MFAAGRTGRSPTGPPRTIAAPPRDVGRPARILHTLVADSLRDPDLLGPIEADLARPVADLASLLEKATAWVAANTQTSRVLELVWRGTGWPQRLRRDALGAVVEPAKPIRRSTP